MRLRHLLQAGAMLSIGCGASRPWDFTPRPASGVPERFTTPEVRNAGIGCRTVLTDPRDDTRLQLFRSTVVERRGPSYLGDDLVIPEGKYGVGSRELLRVNCDDQKPMGIVDRS